MSWLPCKPDERIGEILVRNGYIRSQDLDEALAAQQARGGRIGEVLIQLGRITADHLHLALAEQFKVPHMELTEEMIDDQLWELADPEIWRSFRACPVLEVEGELVVVLAEPPSADRVGALSLALGRAVRPTLGSPAVVDAVIARRTGAPVAPGPDGPIAVESAEHEWIERALRAGAWGLEVRCDGPRIQVRQLFRDGASRPLDLPPEETAAGVCELLAPLASQAPRALGGPGEAVVWSGWVHRRIAGRQLLIQIRRLRAGGCDWSRFTWLGPVPPEPPPEPVRQVLADLAGRTGGLIVAGGRHPPDTEALLWWLGEHLSGDPLHISGGPPAPGEFASIPHACRSRRHRGLAAGAADGAGVDRGHAGAARGYRPGPRGERHRRAGDPPGPPGGARPDGPRPGALAARRPGAGRRRLRPRSGDRLRRLPGTGLPRLRARPRSGVRRLRRQRPAAAGPAGGRLGVRRDPGGDGLGRACGGRAERGQAAGRPAMTDLASILKLAEQKGASDVHLSSDAPPMLRFLGRIERLSAPPLPTSEVEAAIEHVLLPHHLELYRQGRDVDAGFSGPSGARFRVNAYRHSGGAALAMRLIPSRIPTFEDLGLPPVLQNLTLQRAGLILVTGPTGSGKSTSLAAMIEHINQSLPCHVITIEDPIEYLFTGRKALIHQREVGRHTRGFTNALRSAVREDPNVVMVGEMRDLETMRLALHAAETGHMVLSTLHTRSAPQTLDRVVSVFPTEEQAMVRQMLAESLTAVLCQSLLPRADAGGRVAAFELLVANTAIRNLIREGKLHQIPSAIQTGTQLGMASLDQSLRRLVASRVVSGEEAQRASLNPALFK